MSRLTSTYADGPMGSGKEPTVGDIVCRQEWLVAHGFSAMPVMLRAEHGKKITIVCDEDAGSLLVGDGLITWERKLPLVMTHSDCLPIFLWDAEESMCGIVHAGWRGVTAGIVPEALQTIIGKGIAADQLRMVIGPHIRTCCFEIQEDVAGPLREVSTSAVVTRDGKLYGALAEATMSQAIAMGMNIDHITVDAGCTHCTAVNGTPVFASYRREGTIAKNMISVISLS